MIMNKKIQKTYNSIFEKPIKSDILWSDVEMLFISLGAKISEGNGSRVRVELNGVRAVFHRPHPQKAVDKGAVKAIQQFLINAEVNL